jgi:hypothetical protein
MLKSKANFKLEEKSKKLESSSMALSIPTHQSKEKYNNDECNEKDENPTNQLNEIPLRWTKTHCIS